MAAKLLYSQVRNPKYLFSKDLSLVQSHHLKVKEKKPHKNGDFKNS